VYNEVLESITNGTYKPGDRIPSENELKNFYNVSRNTVRLALNKLNTLSIIETKRGDGRFVRKIGANISLNMMMPTILFEKHDLIDILEFRKAVEVQAIKLAAVRSDDKDIKKLRKLLKRMKKMSYDMTKFWRVDTDMHIELAKISKNEMFSTMIEIIQDILTNEMKSLLIKQGTDIDSYFYHNLIIECIEKQKPNEAAYLMEKHLDLVIDRVKKYKLD